VHAGGSSRYSDVDPVVDDDTAGGSPCQGRCVGHERDKRGRLEVAFPDLQEIDARLNRMLELSEQASAGRRPIRVTAAETPSVCYEVENQGPTCVSRAFEY
jgi:hypothetical protein